MNLERINNINSHIETSDIKEKEDILFKKIEQISLVYADKRFSEIKEENSDYKFSDAIKDFTPIKNIIIQPLLNLEGLEWRKCQKKIDSFFEGILGEVNSVYENNNSDLDLVYNIINLKKDLIKKYLGVENLKEIEKEKRFKGTKVLSFNDILNIETEYEQKYKDLEKLGFSNSDHFVEVHVEDFYSTDQKNLGPELINNDLGVIAEYIIDKKPETAAVIGKSWLLDTPLASRLGFNKIEDSLSKQNDFSAWLQFIDKDGQIDKKRFNEFSKTGELSYKSIKAYISTEEFLKRYLPKNRRGKIILKELNQNKKEFWSKLKDDIQSIKPEWDNLLKNNGNFDDFIKNNKSLNQVLSFVSLDEKQKYLQFLKTMYDNNTPWSTFFEHKNQDIEEIDEKINKAMQDDLYQDKEIFVPSKVN